MNNDYISVYLEHKNLSPIFSLADQLIMQWPQSATLTKQKLTHYINRGFLTGHQAAETAKKLWFTDVLYQFKIYLPNQKKYVKFTFFKNFKKGYKNLTILSLRYFDLSLNEACDDVLT